MDGSSSYRLDSGRTALRTLIVGHPDISNAGCPFDSGSSHTILRYPFAAWDCGRITPRAFLVRLAFFHGYGLCLRLPVTRFKSAVVLPRLVQGHGKQLSAL
jgi:hypothetical protein